MRRRHRQTVAVLLAGLIGGAAMQLITTHAQQALAQAPAKPVEQLATIRAREVVLVDDGGKERIRLDGASGNVIVTDAQGTSVITVGFFEDGVGLKVKSPAGHSVFGGGKTSDDGLGMGVWGPNTKLRFGLGWQPKGNGGIVINDEFGTERASMGMPAGGAGISCSIKDRAGTVVFTAP